MIAFPVMIGAPITRFALSIVVVVITVVVAFVRVLGLALLRVLTVMVMPARQLGLDLGSQVQLLDALAHALDGALAGGRIGIGGGLVGLDQLAQLQQLVVEIGGGQRRRQVTDHDAHGAPLGLDALADAVDDVRVDQRQIAAEDVRIVVLGEAGAPPRQELARGVTADIDQRVGFEVLLQPVVEGDVVMRRREGGVGVQQRLVHFPATRWLRSHEDVAEAQAGEQQCAVVHHRASGCLAPAGQARYAAADERVAQRLQFLGVAAAVETTLPAGFELRQQIQRARLGAMVDLLEHVAQIGDAAPQRLLAEGAFLLGHGLPEAGVHIADRAVLQLGAHALGQHPEVVEIGRRRQRRHAAGNGLEAVAVLGQVDAAVLNHVVQRLGVGGQLAGVVAGLPEAREHLEQRFRHVQLVGADVVTARRVVVVNQRHPLVGIVQRAQAVPALHAGGEHVDAVGHRPRQRQPHAGGLVDLRRLRHRQHHGRDDALQLRHGELVVHRIPGHALRRQAPLRLGEIGEPHALDHRDVQCLESLGHLAAPSAAAYREVLQADDGRDLRRCGSLLDPLHRLDAAPAPACQHREALQLVRLQRAAGLVEQRAVAGPVAGVEVEQRYRRAFLQIERGRIRAGAAVAVVAHAGARRQRRHFDVVPGAGQQPAHQAVDMRRAAAGVEAAAPEPFRLPGKALLQRMEMRHRVVIGLGIGGQLVDAFIAPAREHRLAVQPRQAGDVTVAVGSQHRRLGGRWIAPEQALDAPHLIAEHRRHHHRIGVPPQRHQLLVGELGDLQRCAQPHRMLRMRFQEAVRAGGELGGGAVGHDADDGRRLDGEGTEQQQCGEQTLHQQDSFGFGATARVSARSSCSSAASSGASPKRSAGGASKRRTSTASRASASKSASTAVAEGSGQ